MVSIPESSFLVRIKFMRTFFLKSVTIIILRRLLSNKACFLEELRLCIMLYKVFYYRL